MKLKKKQKGFTLLEILIAMSILMSIVLAVTNMLRNSVDIKSALGEKNTVTQKINRVLYKVSYDLAHAFFLSQVEMLRDGGKGRTIFKIDKGSLSDTISFTYMGHKSTKADSHESSLSYVTYKVQESEKKRGRTHLFRGSFPRVPKSFREDPPMILFSDNVYSLKFFPWNGEKWSKEKWDSSQGATRNKIPHMILVELSIWKDEQVEGESEEGEPVLERYTTIVYLLNSLGVEEIKAAGKRFKF